MKFLLLSITLAVLSIEASGPIEVALLVAAGVAVLLGFLRE